MSLKNPFSKKADDAPEKPDDSAPVVAEPPPITLTDEGMPYESVDAITIINRATEILDARRRELHINGRTFAHVSDAADGAWIYRNDS